MSLTKLELMHYFFDIDYRQCMLSNGHSPEMINRYVDNKLRRLNEGSLDIQSWYGTLSPWCLEMFPELEEFFGRND